MFGHPAHEASIQEHIEGVGQRGRLRGRHLLHRYEPKLGHQGRQAAHIAEMGDNLDGHGQVIEQAARRTVRRVDGADKAPGIRQQGADLRGSHLLEEGAPAGIYKIIFLLFGEIRVIHDTGTVVVTFFTNSSHLDC